MLQCKTKWKKKKLGSICNHITTGKLDAKAMTEGGKYRFYTCAENYYKIDTYAFEGQSLLISGNGANVGYVHYYDGKFNAYQRTYVLQNFDENIFYIKHYLKAYLKDRIAKEVNAGNIPFIKLDTLTDMNIQYPEIKDEQQKIADILSTCDEVIEKTEETIEKYKQIKAGMMQDLFTRGLDENGKLRPTYEQSPNLYKYSEQLDRYIPKEWDIKTFNELIQENVIDSIQDGNHGEKHPKTSDFVATGVPFIMANNLTKDGHIDLKNCNFITYEQYKSLRIGFSTENDVLLTHKGTVGLTAIVPSGVKDIMLTPQVTYYRIKDYSKLDNQYLYTYFQSPMFQNILQGLSEQSTRAYIGITKQAELNCVYMDINEQRNIGKIVAKMNDKLKYEKDILSKYRQIKQGLMKRLLTPPADAEIVEE